MLDKCKGNHFGGERRDAGAADLGGDKVGIVRLYFEQLRKKGFPTAHLPPFFSFFKAELEEW